MPLKTTPIYIWNVTISDKAGQVWQAGTANYTGGTSGTNMTAFAFPANVPNVPLSISGYTVGTNEHVEFPAVTLDRVEGAIAYLSTTGWEQV